MDVSITMKYGVNPFLKHEDFYVVTDIKDDNYLACKYIADNWPELRDRFVIQIYHIEEWEDIYNLGFGNIILTLYRTLEEERTPEVLVNDVKSCNLLGVTFWDNWSDVVCNDELKDIDVLLFVHTVNDISSIKTYVDDGFLIYTDNTQNAWLR